MQNSYRVHDPREDTESSGGLTFLASGSMVTESTIRERILKDRLATVPPKQQAVSYRVHDPREDTERLDGQYAITGALLLQSPRSERGY